MNKSSKFNLGLNFSKLFESDYAVVRRFLVTNLAANNVALSTFSEQLRRSLFPEPMNVTERILKLQPDYYQAFIPIKSADIISTKFHCPECAKNLFHTELFKNSQWLTHCPIHDCELTKICPKCGNPWPSTNEIQGNLCSVCGCPNIKQVLSEYNNCNNDHIAHNLDPYYDFIYFTNSQYITIKSSDGYLPSEEKNTFKEIQIHDVEFASCQKYLHPRFSKKKLSKLHIKINPIYYKKTKLIESNSLDSTTMLESQNKDELIFKIGLKVFNEIVAATKKHLDCEHSYYIHDFRGLKSTYFNQNGHICPYCMALSLWFYNFAYYRYRKDITLKETSYPFAADAGFKILNNISLPDIEAVFRFKRYETDLKFRSWILERELKIIFLKNLSYSSFIVTQPNLKTPFWMRKKDNERETCFKSQKFYADTKANQLYFFYFIDDPISEIDFRADINSKHRTPIYQNELFKMNKANIVMKINGNKVSKKQFNLMHSLYLKSMEQMYYESFDFDNSEIIEIL